MISSPLKASLQLVDSTNGSTFSLSAPYKGSLTLVKSFTESTFNLTSLFKSSLSGLSGFTTELQTLSLTSGAVLVTFDLRAINTFDGRTIGIFE